MESDSQLEMQKSIIQKKIHDRWWWNFWTTLLFWLGILVFLSFVGFNVFSALGETSDFFAKIVDAIKDFFAPVLKLFGLGATVTAKQTIKTGSKGATGIIDSVSNTTVSGIDHLQKKIYNPNNEDSDDENSDDEDSEKKKEQKKKDDKLARDNVNNVQGNENKQMSKDELIKIKGPPKDNAEKNFKEPPKQSKPPIPDAIQTSNEDPSPTVPKPSNRPVPTQTNTDNKLIKPRFPIPSSIPEPGGDILYQTKTSGPGYCFIGEVNDQRYCVRVNNNVGEECPTGRGFEKQEVCIDPYNYRN
jgi:hypothetical protein